MDPNMQHKIAHILSKACEAFKRCENTWDNLEDQCACRATQPTPGRFDACSCVAGITDTCIAGTWPQLAFVTAEASAMLKKARAAIVAAQEKELDDEQQ